MCIDNIEDKVVFYIGKEEEFNRKFEIFFNIDEIYKSHKKTTTDCLWNNININYFRVQNIYIAKFENIKINQMMM